MEHPPHAFRITNYILTLIIFFKEVLRRIAHQFDPVLRGPGAYVDRFWWHWADIVREVPRVREPPHVNASLVEVNLFSNLIDGQIYC